MIPPEMELQKDILKIEDLIACCYDEEERKIKRRVNGKNATFSASNGKERLKIVQHFVCIKIKYFINYVKRDKMKTLKQ